MALSNTAVPKYYGMFRDAVIRGEIPVCKEISMEMNRVDDLIANPGIYYDDQAVEGWIAYCESELTLTDGSDLNLLDSFKLWGEQVYGWYYFVERSVWEPSSDGHGGRYVNKRIKQRLIKPSMIKTNDRWQYPLAYIRVNSGVTSIRQANITNTVGTSECPFVTAPLEKMSIDALVAQWKDQWDAFYEKETSDMEATNTFWKDQWSKQLYFACGN